MDLAEMGEHVLQAHLERCRSGRGITPGEARCGRSGADRRRRREPREPRARVSDSQPTRPATPSQCRPDPAVGRCRGAGRPLPGADPQGRSPRRPDRPRTGRRRPCRASRLRPTAAIQPGHRVGACQEDPEASGWQRAPARPAPPPKCSASLRHEGPGDRLEHRPGGERGASGAADLEQRQHLGADRAVASSGVETTLPSPWMLSPPRRVRLLGDVGAPGDFMTRNTPTSSGATTKTRASPGSRGSRRGGGRGRSGLHLRGGGNSITVSAIGASPTWRPRARTRRRTNRAPAGGGVVHTVLEGGGIDAALEAIARVRDDAGAAAGLGGLGRSNQAHR